MPEDSSSSSSRGHRHGHSHSHSHKRGSTEDDKWEWPYKSREDYNRYHPDNAIPDVIYVRSPITGEDAAYPGWDVYNSLQTGVTAHHTVKEKSDLPTFWTVRRPACFPFKGFESTPVRHLDIGRGDWGKALDGKRESPMISWPLLVDQASPSLDSDNQPPGHTDDYGTAYVGPEVVWQYTDGWVPLWVGCRWHHVFYDFECLTNPLRPDHVAAAVPSPVESGADWDQLGGVSESSEWRYQYAAIDDSDLLAEVESPAAEWGNYYDPYGDQQYGGQEG